MIHWHALLYDRGNPNPASVVVTFDPNDALALVGMKPPNAVHTCHDPACREGIERHPAPAYVAAWVAE